MQAAAHAAHGCNPGIAAAHESARHTAGMPNSLATPQLTAQVASYADGNPDYPGSCGRCYEVGGGLALWGPALSVCAPRVARTHTRHLPAAGLSRGAAPAAPEQAVPCRAAGAACAAARLQFLHAPSWTDPAGPTPAQQTANLPRPAARAARSSACPGTCWAGTTSPLTTPKSGPRLRAHAYCWRACAAPPPAGGAAGHAASEHARLPPRAAAPPNCWPPAERGARIAAPTTYPRRRASARRPLHPLFPPPPSPRAQLLPLLGARGLRPRRPGAGLSRSVSPTRTNRMGLAVRDQTSAPLEPPPPPLRSRRPADSRAARPIHPATALPRWGAAARLITSSKY
jgi:hypothetical protein